MEIADVYGLLQTWGYPALLGLLLLTAIGSPVPEDLLLIAAGYLVSADVLAWAGVLPVTLLGVIASDTMLYAAGRHLPWRSGTAMEERVLSPRRLRRATAWFDRLGPWTVLIARLVPGTRVLIFVTAGIRGMSVWKFLKFDVLGAAIWVPLLLFAGHAAGHGLGGLHEAFESLNRSAALVLVLAEDASVLEITASTSLIQRAVGPRRRRTIEGASTTSHADIRWLPRLPAAEHT